MRLGLTPGSDPKGSDRGPTRVRPHLDPAEHISAITNGLNYSRFTLTIDRKNYLTDIPGEKTRNAGASGSLPARRSVPSKFFPRHRGAPGCLSTSLAALDP